MLGLADLRKGKGKIIVLDNEPYVITSAEFLRKQQRRPVVRTTLKHLRTNATREHSFQQSDRIPEADVERREGQFLYREGEQLVFMDQQTYEQWQLDADIAGAAARLLVEGQAVDVITFEGTPVSVELPIKVDRKVIDAPPGVRGDTSSNVMKEVTIEGGAIVKAPLFVNQGDIIRIDTRDGSYVERASG